MLSVVMSVYYADDPDHFKDAVDSVFNQTIPPSELVIAVDGPVGVDIQDALDEVKILCNVRLLKLKKNLGPGASRHAAIKICKYDIIAVMDADDLCDSKRFENQLKRFADHKVDVVGAYIEEFDYILGDNPRVRTVPITHNEILERGRWRNPMNHVTIMFRKRIYKQVGGYSFIRWVEDYDLIHRMFIAGGRFENIPEVLVYVRCGTKVLAKRRGLDYLRTELKFLCRMRSSGFLNTTQWIANSLIRISVRLMPRTAIGLLYKYLLRLYDK
jgi:glycosyltransferase involved in cell wall biosynthesis